MIETIATLPISWLSFISAIIGLLVGSFLNVVVFRYPVMMKYQWTVQSREWLEIEPLTDPEPPTLSKPASHCSQCKTPIRAWQNIPLLSWLLLRGRCASCSQQISIRYPLVELMTAMFSAMVVYKFGFSLQAGFGLILTWVLVALSFIDFDHKLLPDDIVIPILWLGLALSLVPVFGNTNSAVLGAIAGYLVFWIVFQVFLRLTGKEGMGYGDFKLMALLGAWLGWPYLPQIILISTILGSIIGITLMVIKRESGEMAIPFGPYIALAGWLAMIWGDEINMAYFNYMNILP
ncbi:MAG: leader peptidase (prepilin peptidase)/N-methyltransferase [Arenicella sp.]|jgi:leader peptidase (prepilin peptidase)/N-methyltransferase